MKQILLLFFLCFLSYQGAQASEQYFIPVDDYVQTDFERMFEIKSTEQHKVILDCQSFFAGLNIYNEQGLAYNHNIDHGQCFEIHNFLQDSAENSLPVCIEVFPKEDRLFISRKTKDCQSQLLE